MIKFNGKNIMIKFSTSDWVECITRISFDARCCVDYLGLCSGGAFSLY